MTSSIPANVLDEWVGHLQQQGKSQHTVRAYRRGLVHFSRWYEGAYGSDFAPDDVMPRDVRDAMNDGHADFQRISEILELAQARRRIGAIKMPT